MNCLGSEGGAPRHLDPGRNDGHRRRAPARCCRARRPRRDPLGRGQGGTGGREFPVRTATDQRADPGHREGHRPSPRDHPRSKLLADAGLVGLPERGQVDAAPLADLQDAPRLGWPRTSSRPCLRSSGSSKCRLRPLRPRRPPRAHRGRARGQGPRNPVPPARRAHPRPRALPRPLPARGERGRRLPDGARGDRGVRARPRRASRARRRHEGRPRTARRGREGRQGAGPQAEEEGPRDLRRDGRGPRDPRRGRGGRPRRGGRAARSGGGSRARSTTPGA